MWQVIRWSVLICRAAFGFFVGGGRRFKKQQGGCGGRGGCERGAGGLDERAQTRGESVAAEAAGAAASLTPPARGREE